MQTILHSSETSHVHAMNNAARLSNGVKNVQKAKLTGFAPYIKAMLISYAFFPENFALEDSCLLRAVVYVLSL